MTECYLYYFKCSWYLSINVLINIKLREEDAVPLSYIIIPHLKIVSCDWLTYQLTIIMLPDAISEGLMLPTATSDT